MITVKFSPVRSNEEPLTASWMDPVLTVKSVEYDLSLLEDGSTATHPVLGNVYRVGNDYGVTLMLPHGSNAPESTRFPEDIIVEDNGNITIPVYN